MQCGVCLGLHGDECVCENATLCACVDVGNACLECNRLFVSFVDVYVSSYVTFLRYRDM